MGKIKLLEDEFIKEYKSNIKFYQHIISNEMLVFPRKENKKEKIIGYYKGYKVFEIFHPEKNLAELKIKFAKNTIETNSKSDSKELALLAKETLLELKGKYTYTYKNFDNYNILELIKRNILSYDAKGNDYEKKFQQEIAINGIDKYIVLDTEYTGIAASFDEIPKNGRPDILALKSDGRITFMVLKFNEGALRGKQGIFGHLKKVYENKDKLFNLDNINEKVITNHIDFHKEINDKKKLLGIDVNNMHEYLIVIGYSEDDNLKKINRTINSLKNDLKSYQAKFYKSGISFLLYLVECEIIENNQISFTNKLISVSI